MWWMTLLACDDTVSTSLDGVDVDCDAHTLDRDQTWSGVVEVGCSLNVSARLVLEPGTEVRLPADASLVFGEGGSLEAVGEADRPIAILGGSGRFTSLVFVEPEVPSTLAFVTVSGGGTPDLVFGEGMLVVGDGAFAAGNLSLRDCVLDDSGSVGLDLRWGEARVERTVVTRSAGPSVVTALELAPALVADLEVDGDVVLDPTDVVEGRAVDLPELAVPFRLRQTVSVWAPTTVPPGTTFELDPDVGLWVGADTRFAGSLAFEGTGERPITVRPTGDGGPWGSVTFATVDPDNRMSHVVLEGGGAPGIFGVGALVTLDGNAAGSLDIRDCELRDSVGYGLAVDGQVVNADAGTANVFVGNAAGDIRW